MKHPALILSSYSSVVQTTYTFSAHSIDVIDLFSQIKMVPLPPQGH